MNLTFANFKQVIPTQILTRGRDYLRKGYILDLSFDEEEMLWEAQVEGTELYDVRVEQAMNGALSCSCTCPYDMGEYCKHVAAVLYAIEETFPEQLIVKPKRRSAKRQTRHDKLRQRIEKTPHEQLVAIVLELAGQDRELLNQLLIRLDAGETKPMDYRRVVKDALRVGRGDYGYLDYAGSNRAGRKIEQLLDQAQQWVQAGEVEKAVGVYQAVIDETVSAIAYADDSNGTLGGCISLAVEGLDECADLLDEVEREALFAFCLERAHRPDFRGWDWGWDLLSVAVERVNDSVYRALFESALEGIEEDVRKSNESEFYSQYGLEQIALFRLSLIERFEGSVAARVFLQSQIHLDRLLMILIERSINENKLDEAMTLIEAGIASSEERRLPGLTNQYRALRVNLLQVQGDKSALVEAARVLWLDQGDENTFTLLKQTIPATEWMAFVDQLIKDIRRTPDQLAWLYAHENRWRDLISLVKSSQHVEWLIESYREPLESHFPAEVADLYERTVETIMARASGRDHYRLAVAYLRRIKKLDQSGRVEEIVGRLRNQYPKRPALLDELSNL